MTIHHMINFGFLHSTQSRTEDKPHNKQDNRRVQEVNEPNTKSVCGHTGETKKALVWSGSALHTYCFLFSSGEGSWFCSEISQAKPSEAVAFFKWSDIEGSGLKSLTVCCQNSSLFKWISVVLGLCRPPLVLLIISSGVSAGAGPCNVP